MFTTISLFAIGIFLGSCGALFFKVGIKDITTFSPTLSWFYALLTNPYIFLGFLSYVLPMFIWMYMLSKFPVSYVQPILALTYAITPILALLFLKEPVPSLRWIGILVIITGVFLISKS
ncbi:MAG: EamA family transporter [Candidatus Moranbacteria bacterium]|nr:EamA family transporter [Candidatus Moranbacteria bacterium]